MVLVLALIGLGLFILGVYLMEKMYDEFPGAAIGVIGGIIFVVCLLAVIVLGVKVSNLSVIDDKIAMYEEENTKIESQIAEAVQKYQEYETGIFTEVAPESSMTLVSLYPELKADSLVSKQIEIYLNNHDSIKSLKEQKINGSVYRWWLYFGKVR